MDKFLTPFAVTMVTVAGVAALLASRPMGSKDRPYFSPPSSPTSNLSTNQPASFPTAMPIATSAPVPTSIPITAPVPKVINGPTFQEVDLRMDDRISTWTQAQKDAYWRSVMGTRIQWDGEVVEVRSDKTGDLTMKCNPNSFGCDTYVTLDGTQLNSLAGYSKGQRLRFSGLMTGHGLTGYTIVDGHID